jgi:hypothetical protein
VLGWFFVAIGVIELAAGVWPLVDMDAGRRAAALHAETPGVLVTILIVRLLAIVGGMYILKGYNWARWLIVAWVLFHVAISAEHAVFEVAVHGVLAAIILILLFRRPASAYFRAGATAGTVT